MKKDIVYLVTKDIDENNIVKYKLELLIQCKGDCRLINNISCTDHGLQFCPIFIDCQKSKSNGSCTYKDRYRYTIKSMLQLNYMIEEEAFNLLL